MTHSSKVLKAVKFVVCLKLALALSWQMPVVDFLTTGSTSVALGLAAAGVAGVAATVFAGAAGAVTVAAAGVAGAVLGVAVVCADATKPAVASNAKIRVFFNMCVLQKHGNDATYI